VLVLAANDTVAAHFGELSMEALRRRKVRGAVVDGATRDASLIARAGFPTFVRYRTPQDSVPRWRVSDWGQPVTIGGVRISLGDIVQASASPGSFLNVQYPQRSRHRFVMGRKIFLE